jgi:3-hydroxyisobutyrate dehydrogenase
MTTIGFVGLGNMGGGMAANLVKAGHVVQAFDLSQAALDAAVAAGCRACDTAVAAVQNVDAVVTMLPNGGIVDAFYHDHVFGHAPATAILIDCSTIDVGTAQSVANDAGDGGYAMVDAPVSGGIAAAAAGTLTFMVGGSHEATERARPILEAMGKAVIHAGASGAGQAAKICNNMILGATMAVTTEAFTLAAALGLDAQAFYDIASVSSGQSWSLTSYCPVPGVGPVTPADRGYEGGFATALMLKDMRLALDAAQLAGTAVPVATRAAARYQAAADAGQGSRDFSVIITLPSD